jgi:hypothetical protein
MGGVGQSQPTYLYRTASAFAFERCSKTAKFSFQFSKKSRPPAKKKKSGKFCGFGNQLKTGAEAGTKLN